MTAELKAARQDATLTITLSNPGSDNALDPSMLVAAIETLSAVDRDESVRAVVITGADGQFCRGLDLPKDMPSRLLALESLHSLIDLLRSYRKPVIAAVDGIVADAGVALALACDLVVATRQAHFSLSPAQRGVWANGGVAWLLAHALPPALLAELHLDATPMPAQRLHAAGALNRLAADGRALEEAQAWAERIAAQTPAAPQAVEQLKELLHGARSQSLGEHFSGEKHRLAAQRG
ncbi:enoyl-CoA hydratase/isomerase family protein [Herbaspirillum sp. LeCh32-8]|uniref:enoyl-CoA hydratase-related protein n=1 Tax=Herbaspirillum sp. LeCh32-8 TaxID=2821356 RepID=UPI001AE305D5|nr:enoyl-CoA hydratase-related protein [Herbaspirillum sp. LeCh32-8]MBP0599657.1 enoyl-CoA hydratase/isomerase family protein [Herbaspirillum sp. LeCh32-8]